MSSAAASNNVVSVRRLSLFSPTAFYAARRLAVMALAIAGFGIAAIQPAAAEKNVLADFGSAIARKLKIGKAEGETLGSVRSAAQADADPQFRSLFDGWKKLDALSQGVISIPSSKPVEGVTLTSAYGVRSDPFRGGAAMHAGIDLAGPIGTPVYATADGMIGRAGWASGYGNLVEIDHGKGIQTRFGHLSKILVSPNSRVRRGQLIALMGSTGRSTGSHLHYEVRIDGRAVNPVPFLQSADYVVAMQQRTANQQIALGGPEE
ncbi:M23 family metallopeptidase [Sphingomonas oleivorans]|nr:M23 family metallopeptidase [Sphingomonas oleivorans]